MDKQDVILSVPYLSQRNLDAKHKSDRPRACGPTALAMALQYHKIPKVTPEAILDYLDTKIPLTFAEKMFGKIPQVRNKNIEQIWRMLDYSCDYFIGGQAAADRNEKYGTFTYATFDDIVKEIDKGRPVVVGGKFTNSGHYVLIIGYRQQEINGVRNITHFYVNDSLGEWDAKRPYKNHNGEKSLFRKETLDRLLHNENRDKGGSWAKKRVLLINPKG